MKCICFVNPNSEKRIFLNLQLCKVTRPFCRHQEKCGLHTYATEHSQDRTKLRGLIKRGAGEYEAKRISEAEQKHAQRKARAKASPTELSS